jgi:hypothetical protein
MSHSYSDIAIGAYDTKSAKVTAIEPLTLSMFSARRRSAGPASRCQRDE